MVLIVHTNNKLVKPKKQTMLTSLLMNYKAAPLSLLYVHSFSHITPKKLSGVSYYIKIRFRLT